MEADYQVSSQDVNDDTCIEEHDLNVDCDGKAGTSGVSITNQAKEQTQRCYSGYIIYADILKNVHYEICLTFMTYATFISHKKYSVETSYLQNANDKTFEIVRI